MIVRMFLIGVMAALLAAPAFAQEKPAKPATIDGSTRANVKAELLAKYGESQKFRIERGIDQVADQWRASDGSAEDFAAYCRDYFVADEAMLAAAFKKLEFYSEVIFGGFAEMGLDKDQPVDLDWGEITPLDMAMNQFSLGAHVSEDLYGNKIAFFSLLNFPVYTLKEKIEHASQWNRQQWAYARVGGTNPTRIPPEVNQKYSTILADANRYVSEYNIFLGSLVDNQMRTLFPADMKLISHWGLRDELKAHYADRQGLPKQQMIFKVMERIIAQEIPAVMVNSGKCQWNPFSNAVYENGKSIRAEREPDTRYQTILNVFGVTRLVDAYSPLYPNAIVRSFDVNREIPEKDVEAMFVELLSSPQAKKVGQLIRRRLGRKLQPFDIWYTGFRGGETIAEEKLDRIVKEKYPTAADFEKDLPNILMKLGFSAERSAKIAPLIQIDMARGSGHCASSGSRKFKVRLRTRVSAGGMNYKGYNIAMHELGHAVESVLDLHMIDYYSLSGVPNNAFTEAFAYVFQDRDREVLGLAKPDPKAWDTKALDVFWNTYEIMGVSLLDMKLWHWLYEHPQATAAELREAEIGLAKELWNRYYAPVFGIKDQSILAIYSHKIHYPLYLPHYSLGYAIQFQIENFLRGKVVGPEMERMCVAGNILPNEWMRLAVGEAISVKPMLAAVDQALKAVK